MISRPGRITPRGVQNHRCIRCKLEAHLRQILEVIGNGDASMPWRMVPSDKSSRSSFMTRLSCRMYVVWLPTAPIRNRQWLVCSSAAANFNGRTSMPGYSA